jgi:8-oxo-dGTP pyrophosphatase MutT (NUDIX family)
MTVPDAAGPARRQHVPARSAGSLAALVRADVLARTPVDEREAASITAFVDHLDALAEPFDEHADPVHVTASAIVIGERGVVLHRHKRLGLWLQPGGHVDAGETPWDAAVREAVEELGLAVEHDRGWLAANGRPRLAHVDVHPGPRGHTHLDLRYVVVAPCDDPAPPAGESPDARWFTWDDAIEVADAGLHAILVSLRPA